MKQITKEEIKDLDVILVASKSMLGKSIQSFLDAKVNHAGVCIWLEGELYISEAEARGLQLVPFNQYMNTDRGFFILQPQELKSKFDVHYMKHTILRETKAHPYDYMSLLVYQPIRQIMRKLFNKKVWIGKKDKYAKKRFYCSEWVAYLYNIFYGKFPDWWLISPKDLGESHFFTTFIPTLDKLKKPEKKEENK